MSRGGLSEAQRERLAVVFLCALRLPNQLSGHVRGALRCGATAAEIEASLASAEPLLDARYAEVRWSTLQELQRVGARPEDAAKLLEMTQDKSAPVRANAAAALSTASGPAPDPEVKRAALRLLDDADAAVVTRTIAAFARAGMGPAFRDRVLELAQRPDVALARVWLVDAADLCDVCHMAAECQARTSCLHLKSSAGKPHSTTQEDWSRLDGFFRSPRGLRNLRTPQIGPDVGGCRPSVLPIAQQCLPVPLT